MTETSQAGLLTNFENVACRARDTVTVVSGNEIFSVPCTLKTLRIVLELMCIQEGLLIYVSTARMPFKLESGVVIFKVVIF